MSKNTIGLNKQNTEVLVKDLNMLLANFQIHYQNLRGLHWNIKGRSFFELHVKFEELYTDAQEKVDMIAERILTLEGTPLHTFSDYNKNASVPIGEDISKDEEAVSLIVISLLELLKIERAILVTADKVSDEGTNAMMSDFITEQEKTVWMMKSWLN